MDVSPEQLCERAQRGDVAAASQLLACFHQKIYAYFRRQCATDEDAEDLTQRTFVKAWASLPSYGKRSTFSTWLHGIAHFVYVDWRRKRNLTDAQTDEWWALQPADTASPFENAAEHDLACTLYALAQKLEPELQEPVHLHYYQGLSLAETAEVLGVGVSTVKNRLRAALDTLRAKLGNETRKL